MKRGVSGCFEAFTRLTGVWSEDARCTRRNRDGETAGDEGRQGGKSEHRAAGTHTLRNKVRRQHISPLLANGMGSGASKSSRPSQPLPRYASTKDPADMILPVQNNRTTAQDTPKATEPVVAKKPPVVQQQTTATKSQPPVSVIREVNESPDRDPPHFEAKHPAIPLESPPTPAEPADNDETNHKTATVTNGIISQAKADDIFHVYADHIFKSADEDHDGYLNESEFCILTQAPTLGLDISDEEAIGMMTDGCHDPSVGVSMAEFIPILKDLMIRHCTAKQDAEHSDHWKWFTMLFESDADLLPVYYNTIDDVMTYDKPSGVSRAETTVQAFENVTLLDGTVSTDANHSLARQLTPSMHPDAHHIRR